jgi:hypothetical protein
MNRLPARERYKSDPVFSRLVDILLSQLMQQDKAGLHYTPTELREAVLLAAMMYEAQFIRPLLYDHTTFLAEPAIPRPMPSGD